MTITRRKLLHLAATAVPALALPGCTWARVHARCRDWGVEPEGPLAIDAHAHFFNASDLPVSGFVQRVLLKSGSPAVESISDILRDLVWSAAPNGEEELQLLGALSRELAACPADAVPLLVRKKRQERYEQAVAEIRATARAGGPKVSATDVERAAGELPRTYEEYSASVEVGGDVGVKKKTVSSALRFVIEMLQYRVTGFFDYLEAYRKGGGPRLDLSLSALVDYDFWLGPGPRPPTDLWKQLEVARDLAILTGGRVHPWVPFCPLRQILHDRDKGSKFSPMQLVEEGIGKYGAVGVKLYPPMGFAPAGNAGERVWTEDGVDWLPPITRDPDFGEWLDDAMDGLFAFCQEREVPILTHSAASNGPRASFRALALSDHWRKALQNAARRTAEKGLPPLRVLFGHLGGAGDPNAAEHAAGFRDLMREEAPEAGAGAAYADVSYFDAALENADGLTELLWPLFKPQGGERPILLDRLCYGTDWKMMAVERHAERFAARMDQVIRTIASRCGVDPAAQARSFFGGNAATLLGLRAGQRTRERLDSFYATHQVPKPGWALKLDGRA